jgi:hypothetical protein
MAHQPVSRKRRFEVFRRDNFTCQYCGMAAPNVQLQVDHIEPKHAGGVDGIVNLITSCSVCNAGKGGAPLAEENRAIVRNGGAMANRGTNGQFLPGHSLGFQPGQSGNPAGGRPATAIITDALRAQLANDRDGSNLAEQIAGALIAAALAGDITACREIADRVEGKPRQSVTIEPESVLTINPYGIVNTRIVAQLGNGSGAGNTSENNGDANEG